MKSSEMASVCYVYQDEYPWDIRVEKIATSLAEEGFDTTILCRNRRGLARREDLGVNLHLERLPRGVTSIDRAFLNFPAFFSPIWIGRTVDCVREKRVRLIIVRDLPLAPMAFIVGQLVRIPVVMDMAENYPAMIRDTWTHRGPRVADYVIRNPRALAKLERAILPRLDGVIAVTEASAARVRNLTRGKIYVVGNTPRLAGLDRIVSESRPDNQLRLIYVGGLEESRGLEYVVRALALLPAHTVLTIAGRGTGENAIRRLSRDLGVADRVNFTGWIDPAAIPQLIASSDVCLVPHLKTEHTDTTMPNKIFDYMAMGKPVVVTDAQALKDLVKETRCGLWYEDRSYQALADCVCKLSNADLRMEMGERGRLAVMTKYNWSIDKINLVGAIRELTAGRH